MVVVVRRKSIDNSSVLVHHGIKGQKWGVRRTPEELGHCTKTRFYDIIGSHAIVTPKGTKITEFSDHASKQLKDPTRPVSYGDILNAVREPLHVKDVVYDDEGRPSQKYIGKRATAAVNPETGVITTIWKTGRKTAKKYSKEEKNIV